MIKEFCGESGSGKTQIRNLIIRHLVRLSSHKKETKVQAQLVHSQAILDCFGSAATHQNKDASRYGYYAEVQFSERGRMIGAKIIHHFLEKSRLTSSSDANFQVFYHLVRGASDDERQQLQLQDEFNYLRHYQQRVSEQDNLVDLKSALKLAGFRREHISRILQLLAAILHLGNLSFVDPGGVNNQDAAYVKNTDILDLVADFLGVDPRALENVLVFKTAMIRKDVTTLILNAEQASLQRDELARTLYSLLFAWIVERVNSKLCAEKFNSFIGIVDLPGYTQPPAQQQQASKFHSLVVNLAAERIHGFMTSQLFATDVYDQEGISVPHVTPRYQAANVHDFLYRPSRGVCSLVHSMSENVRKGKKQLTDADLVDSLIKYNSNSAYFSSSNAPGSQQRQFAIQHFQGNVTYDPNGFLEANSDQVLVDFVSLFRGGPGMPASWNAFLVELWDKNLATQSHPKDQDAVVSAQQKPMRQPSMRQSVRRTAKQQQQQQKEEAATSVLGNLQVSMDELFGTLEEAKIWTVYCLRPNESQTAAQADSRCLSRQVAAFGLADVAQQTAAQYGVAYTHEEFLERYAAVLNGEPDRLPRAQTESVVQQMGWTATDAAVGSTKIFLGDAAWRVMEDQLRVLEKDEQRRNKDASKVAAGGAIAGAGAAAAMEDDELMYDDTPPMTRDGHDPEESLLQRDMSRQSGSDFNLMGPTGLPPPPVGRFQQQDDQRSFYSDDEYYYHDNSSRGGGGYRDHDDSVYGSESYGQENMMLRPTAPVMEKENLDETEEDESQQSGQRKRWLFFVWAVTWWIPSKFLIWCGRMKRKDVRIAWREKVALCMIIVFLCAFIIWFLVFFGEIVCPHQAVFSESELQSYSEKEKSYVSIRGEVFDLTNYAPRHYVSNIIPTDTVLEYGGTDVTDLFPVQVSALCEGTTGSVSEYVSLNYQVNLTDDNAQYHDFRYSSGTYQPDWYYQKITMLRQNYKLGHMGYEPKAISDQASSETTVHGVRTTRKWAIIDEHVYDLTQYDMGGRYVAAPPNEQAPGNIDLNFMDQAVVNLFRQKSGEDISEDWRNLNMDAAAKQRQLVCLRNLFFVGMVDGRNSAKCQFSTYLLLIVTCLLCAVIVFKFLAAFRLGSARVPEELDKFIITQVTCYTEDEESLRKTIDSIATLRYDDKRKLLFVICDGMIVGSGNDKPTPRIVLDILGVDPQVDPEPLSFVSVGEGQKQHNMGKIYSGLYETSGHVVPYLVVVKCGKPTERSKPGNRGKRDSQLILMQFLNRVHFDAPMTPLQLEIYHQMKNVIGVSPSLYEYVLMVDADTEVMPDGMTYLASSMAHDSKIIGVCGETNLSNEKATWTTMIQVYEYFISHHMIKAFESLFSTVTCLPGCFTMYRIRTVDGRRPLFCSNDIINDYQINKVDTLHKKNLLHLGEDRYLTTLLLKHFPNFKTKFAADAQCQTNAPDMWSVLVSQRRRWINSTIHNLGELAFLPRLCGFCCFSMRFIVMLDLISTLVMPAIVGYLGYLIYKLTQLENTVPYLTIIVLAGTYGLQALLFIVKRRWEYILWMLVSILAIPVFWFYIPLYSYWHFDDFSWGNTRVVVGEKGKKIQTVDEGEFDPKSIPTMTWSQYEKMLLADDYWSDGMSQGSSSRSSFTHRSRARGASGAATPMNESVYGGAPMNDTMSMYTHSMMMNNNSPSNNNNINNPPSQAGFYADGNSVMMPSSASIPMMPYTTSQPHMRSSMVSQQMPQQRPSMMASSSSFMMQPPPPPASVHGSSQSLLMEDFNNYSGPSNEEILAEVKQILAAADLTKVTKKQVREELQAVFGVSMAGRKDYINACIENVLQGRM
ncbi:chitin synthase-domain-containing protein [Zychaea mexicana]|uniref:chitin synthase-domain-containing protein n=1 Tax=Zychaea mexicana TaxID=64656 RepID=UPI0022FF2811|nr:chitin synthase-domain-containing protein [Zychaea mexicana]KAI9499463.1 chitin synthase-domain-containing protein [Zychaea mexicana]